MLFTNKYTTSHKYRFDKTLIFFKKHIPEGSSILDLGVDNPFSEIMRSEGYQVINTQGEDLDLDLGNIKNVKVDVVTAFQIFEHLISPFNVLNEINAKKLVATVPLRLWFASAYKSKINPWHNHFHEFEDWQFNWLLEKSGWKIIDGEKWVSRTKINGIRPFLRNFTPRHYAVYAERK